MLLRIGFLASGGGSNMQALMDACKSGELKAEAAVVISNNSDSGALQRADAEGVPNYHFSSVTHPDPNELDRAVVGKFIQHQVDVVMLAGYMKKLGPKTLDRFSGRVLNIHPALLPKFGGKGMYGIRVHTAVIAAGEKESGVTIHLVDAQYDTGAILGQAKVPVEDGDTPESLAARVLEREHSFLVEIFSRIASGELVLRLPSSYSS